MTAPRTDAVTVELLPCPFCGGKAKFITINTLYPHRVICTNCGLTSGNGTAFVNDKFNAENWNHRTSTNTIDELQRENERLGYENMQLKAQLDHEVILRLMAQGKRTAALTPEKGK